MIELGKLKGLFAGGTKEPVVPSGTTDQQATWQDMQANYSTRPLADRSEIETRTGYIRHMQQHGIFIESHETGDLTPLSQVMRELGVVYEPPTHTISAEQKGQMVATVRKSVQTFGPKITTLPTAEGFKQHWSGSDFKGVIQKNGAKAEFTFDSYGQKIDVKYEQYSELEQLLERQTIFFDGVHGQFKIRLEAFDRNGKLISYKRHKLGAFRNEVYEDTPDAVSEAEALISRLLSTRIAQA